MKIQMKQLKKVSIVYSKQIIPKYWNGTKIRIYF